MKRSKEMTKLILESLEQDTFHKLKQKYLKSNDKVTRFFGEHLYDCIVNKWNKKLWSFDALFEMPEWAEKVGNYSFIFILTTSGQAWLNWLREEEEETEGELNNVD